MKFGRRLPLFCRVSASDWAEGGWDLAQTIELSQERLKPLGVDLIDASSGGAVPYHEDFGRGLAIRFRLRQRSASRPGLRPERSA